MTSENINNKKKSNLEKKINHWLTSIESLLDNIPTLEINTIIVDRITPSYFIPEKIYQDIYLISEENLQKNKIHKSLWPSYLELRNNLELEYLIIEPTKAKLPNHDQEIKELLHEIRFLNSLKKIGEVKQILDAHNQKLNTQETGEDGENKVSDDLIYVQTKINLDGIIINRYSQEILNHTNKDIILEIHRDSVDLGQKQWRELIQNLIELSSRSL